MKTVAGVTALYLKCCDFFFSSLSFEVCPSNSALSLTTLSVYMYLQSPLKNKYI